MIFLKQFESESLQLSLFVVSSIFIGFSTTALAIFSVLSSHKMVVKVAQTSVMSEKISRFTKMYGGIDDNIFVIYFWHIQFFKDIKAILGDRIIFVFNRIRLLSDSIL